jgi:uncharacterized membrane protein
MRKIIIFLKDTFLGGVLVVLPAWLAVLLLLKALTHLQVLVKPVSKHLPESVDHPRLMAIGLMLALCFVVGALIRTTFGRRVEKVVEKRMLEKVPGYTTLRGIAEQVGDLEENHGFKPALIEIEEALAPGFIVEEHAGGKCTVFIPSSPTPMAGSIYIIDSARVHPVNVPVTSMFKCMTKWGTGAGELLAAMHSETLSPKQKTTPLLPE